MHLSPFRSIQRRPSQPRSGRWRHHVVSALLALGTAGAVLGATAEARALPLITLSGSVRGLYGSALGDPPLSAYGAGLGLRAGVTLPASLYLGGALDYFFGESETIAGLDVSASLLQVLAHVGYDAGVGPFVLRPSVGFGFAQASGELGGEDVSEGDFVLSPGAEFVVGLGLLSVSAEARYNKVFADGDADAFIIGAGLGFSL